MGIWGIIGLIASALVSIWASVKYLLTQSMRLDDNISKNLMPIVRNAKRRFDINNEISINKKYPSTYSTFVYLNGIPFYFSRGERLLTAGWQSKELVSEIAFFRWHKKKIEKLDLYSWQDGNQFYKYFWYDQTEQKAYYFDFDM